RRFPYAEQRRHHTHTVVGHHEDWLAGLDAGLLQARADVDSFAFELRIRDATGSVRHGDSVRRACRVSSNAHRYACAVVSSVKGSVPTHPEVALLRPAEHADIGEVTVGAGGHLVEDVYEMPQGA